MRAFSLIWLPLSATDEQFVLSVSDLVCPDPDGRCSLPDPYSTSDHPGYRRPKHLPSCCCTGWECPMCRLPQDPAPARCSRHSPWRRPASSPWQRLSPPAVELPHPSRVQRGRILWAEFQAAQSRQAALAPEELPPQASLLRQRNWFSFLPTAPHRQGRGVLPHLVLRPPKGFRFHFAPLWSRKRRQMPLAADLLLSFSQMLRLRRSLRGEARSAYPP